jgi:putative transposase
LRGETYHATFTGDAPLLRHVRTRVRSPQADGVIERFFGTLKYEHLYRALIDDGGRRPIWINSDCLGIVSAPRTIVIVGDLSRKPGADCQRGGV